MQEILTYLSQHRILHHENHGITVCNVEEKKAGIALGKALLEEVVNKKTMLYLSGGSLQALYEQLAEENSLHPGAVGLIDERFGEPMHPNSNEKMMYATGLLRIFSLQNIPFYPILQTTTSLRANAKQSSEDRHALRARDDGKTRIETAQAYDGKVRTWQAVYQKHVGLMGIGPDGHISSIIPNRSDFHNPWFDADRQHLLVSEFNDPKSKYKERVGMTFLGLSMLDVLLVFVFGDSKKEALEKLFEDDPETEIPARFFKRPEIAGKTLFITDQRI